MFIVMGTITTFANILICYILNLGVQETWVRSLGWEDPLQKEMATHSSYFCLENPMNKEA